MATTEKAADSSEFDVAFPPGRFALIQEHAPAAYRRLRKAHEQAFRAADPELLLLARETLRPMIGPAPAPAEPRDAGPGRTELAAVARRSDADVYTPAERACLAFTEQFALSVADVDDALIQDLLAALPAAEVYGLVNAIYVLDALERLSATLAALSTQEGPQ